MCAVVGTSDDTSGFTSDNEVDYGEWMSKPDKVPKNEGPIDSPSSAGTSSYDESDDDGVEQVSKTHSIRIPQPSKRRHSSGELPMGAHFMFSPELGAPIQLANASWSPPKNFKFAPPPGFPAMMNFMSGRDHTHCKTHEAFTSPTNEELKIDTSSLILPPVSFPAIQATAAGAAQFQRSRTPPASSPISSATSSPPIIPFMQHLAPQLQIQDPAAPWSSASPLTSSSSPMLYTPQ